MKTNHWLVVLGVLGGVGCGGDSTMNGETKPGVENARTTAITNVVGDDCDTAARCEEIGTGKSFATRAACESERQSFWSDRWSTASCEGKINADKLQACRQAIRDLLCNNLTDQLKTYNTTCAASEVCGG